MKLLIGLHHFFFPDSSLGQNKKYSNENKHFFIRGVNLYIIIKENCRF
jgi:hypothetical protein